MSPFDTLPAVENDRIEQARDDEIARIDTEREKLQKRLAVDLFVESITEAEDVELARLVDAYKTGDTLRLGNLVRDMVGEYLDRVANYNVTRRPS